MRLACVFVPRFPLAVERLSVAAGRPTIIYERNRISEASLELPEAWPGRQLRQARALYPHALYIPADPARYHEASQAMLRALERVAPEVEPDAQGRAYVGVRGLERLFGGGGESGAVSRERTSVLSSSPGSTARSYQLHLQDRSKDLSVQRDLFPSDSPNDERPTANDPYNAIARAIIDAVRDDTGLTPSVAVASSKFVARVAAVMCSPGSVRVIASGEERRFLREQPSSILPFDEETTQRLHALALHTMGEIAALPRPAVEAQFQRIGGRMWDLANGIDPEPLRPRRTPESITERLSFESPVATSEALIMAARQIVKRLCVRLGARSPRRMHARILAEGRLAWERIETFREPPDETRMMVLLKTRLDALQLAEVVDTVEITLSEIGNEPGKQGKLLTETNPQLERLLETVQQIRVRFGRPMMWRAVEVDPCSRHPEDRTVLIPYDA